MRPARRRAPRERVPSIPALRGPSALRRLSALGRLSGLAGLTALAVLPALSATGLAAQSVTGRVVEAESRSPISAVMVALVNERGAVESDVLTDADGRFRFDGMRAGPYQVRVMIPGREAATAGEPVEVGEEDVTVRVVVDASPATGEGLAVRVEPGEPLATTRQVIAGKVLDATNEEPIDGMEVVARNVRDQVVGRALSTIDGRFFFLLDDPGLYRLAVARYGYDSTATAEVAVGADQDLFVELRVQPAAVGMAPITVTAPRNVPFLEGSGFFERMRRGHGTFFTRKDLERIPTAFPSHMLRRVAGVSVRPGGRITMRGVTSLMGGPCVPTVLVDGMRMRGMAVDDAVPMHWIDAIEVYKGAATVPAQWRDAGTCGVIAIWTRH